MADFEPQCPILQCANFGMGYTNRLWLKQGIVLLQNGTVYPCRERTDQSNLVRSTREWPLITHGNNLDRTWERGMNRDNEEIPEVEYKVQLLEAYEMLDVNP